MSMKNSNDTIRKQTCNLPACSAVPQPTAPPRPPVIKLVSLILYREVTAVCSEIYMKTIHCVGRTHHFLVFKFVVHEDIIGV